MRNLFVCHSQANLLLATGLAKGRFIDNDNELILFRDFAFNEALETILKNNFDVFYLRNGTYPAINKKWSKKAGAIYNDVSFIKNTLTKRYDRVFIICDANLQEMSILKQVSKYKKEVEMIWLEDGAYPYFVNTEFVDGLNSNKFTRKLRQLIFKRLFLLGRFYDFEGSYMAGNKNLTKAYLSLKGKERSIFKNKEIIEITKAEFQEGVSTLFPVTSADFVFNDNDLLLALDKLDTYISIDKLNSILAVINNLAVEHDYKVYYKLHPREEMQLEVLNGFIALDKNKAIEYYYALAKGKHINVVGCKSTALMSARILGHNAISVANLTGDATPELIGFYNAIEVNLPLSNSELVEGLLQAK